MYVHVHVHINVGSNAIPIHIFPPQDFLKAGYVVQVVSKLCGKSLRILENGTVDCGGESGTACKFVC